MRWAILAAMLAAAGSANAEPANTDAAKGALQQVALAQNNAAPAPAPELTTTSPPNAAVDRHYADQSAALLEADMDYLVRQAHQEISSGDHTSLWVVLAFSDDFAAGRLPDARATLAGSQGGIHGALSDLLEPFLIAAEGHVDQAVERVDSGEDNLPAPLPEVERALLFESAGRLNEAAAVYGNMIEHLDLTPPGDGEPSTPQEFERALGAARVTHAVYRAALVQHRLGHVDEARRLYGIVAQFAPNSADVQANLARLNAGQQPLEPALTTKSAAGRWMLFLSEYLTQAESLTAMVAQQDPAQGLASSTGATLLQLGLLLSPDASDWRLYAAQQLASAGGLDGAQRIIDLMPADSVFAPDAELVRASIQLERNNDDAAVQRAAHAAQMGADRWSVVASAGDVYRRVGRAQEAVAAYDRALTMAHEAKDRAAILGWRAYAHRFNGEYAAATADMRAALELDQSVDTRLLYVSILMDDQAGWRDGVQAARQLFAEQPDSVLRLNALGYALIQRPEGLEEGYRLLWRGFNYGQTDYAVVDSLGWAYYLYGQFDQARALCERARDLSTGDPNPEILDHLGDIYWRLNRRDDARAAWRSAMEHRPDVPRRQSLQNKIAHGLTMPAPRPRTVPSVNLPTNPAQRGDL